MARFIYSRVSTLEQDYAQQRHCINEYFAKEGIDPTSIEATVVEKISGKVKHTERKLAQLMNRCKSGDTIYVSELSRLGRNLNDLNNIVAECGERNIKLIQCKDGQVIENDSLFGKMLLFVLGIGAEMEVQNTSQRTIMGLADKKAQLVKNKGKGFWKNNGEWHEGGLGRKKGCDLSSQREASIKAKQDAAVAWREASIGYDFVRTLLRNGVPRLSIIEQFNEKHEKKPGTKDNRYTDGYSTRKGSGLSEFTLSKWSQEMAATLVV